MALRRCILLACVALTPVGRAVGQSAAWPLHGHDLGGQRFSPLASIDTANVTPPVPEVDLPQRRHGHLPGHADRGGRRDVRVAPLQRRRGARRRHRARALALHARPAHRQALLRPGQSRRRGLGREGLRRARWTAGSWRSTRRPGPGRGTSTVADYEGSTEATSQLRRDDPLSQVGQTGSTGVGISAAPLVYDGKVFVGIAGVGYGLHPDKGLAVVGLSGQYGRPGLMAAFDARDRQGRCGS